MSTLRALAATLGRIPLKPFVVLGAAVLVPLFVGVINLGIKFNSLDQGLAPTRLVQTLPVPAYDPAKPVAVLLTSADGAEITDFLPNYDILARSGAFNVYVVAPERAVLPLASGVTASSGLDFVPHFSFAEYDATIGRTPDLIAVPWEPNYSPSRDAAVLSWLRSHAGPQTTVLGICSGTMIVADSGLADGHTATTNTGLFDRVQKQDPAVHWVRGVRYVDDGLVVMSTNLAAGMDATLHVVDRFAGRAVAENVARQIGYPTLHYLDDPRWQPDGPYASAIAGTTAHAAFRWGVEDLGVALYDGVDEMALAAVVDPNSLSLSARIHTVGQQGTPVQSLHGLSFVPRYDAASPPHLDRVVTPRAGDGQWPYQAALDDLARAQGRAAASYAGHGLFLLPSPGLPASAGFPFGPLAMAALLGLIGAGAVYGLDHLRRVKIVTKLPLLRQLGGFGLHFAEMSVAMLAGMEVFGALNTYALVPVGFVLFTDRYPQAQLLAMAVSMAVPMVGWMLVRGHGRSHALEMGAAMLIPAVVAVVAGAAGVLPRGEMVMAGHELMWVAMLGLMLVRWNHYAGGQHAHLTPAQSTVRAAQAG